MKLYADGVDITLAIGGLSFQNTVSELATKMSFEVAKTKMQHTDIYLPSKGSIIRLKTDKEVFKGIVLSVDDGSKTANKYTVCDFGWYLNKSKETYQFNKMPAKKAITKICSDFGIDIDNIQGLDNEITGIYFDKAVSDIIKDILEKCGGGYNLDVTPKGLRIYKLGSLFASSYFRISKNTGKINSCDFYGNVSHSVSIEDLKNSVKVITEKDGVYTIKATLKDSSSIAKYGLLQEVIKIDPEKENASTVAKTKLAELNAEKETYSLEIIEDENCYTRAGEIIAIDGKDYLIEGSSHSFKNSIHYVKLDLRRW